MVLVGGIEKMSNLPTAGVTDALATAGKRLERDARDSGFGRSTNGPAPGSPTPRGSAAAWPINFSIKGRAT